MGSAEHAYSTPGTLRGFFHASVAQYGAALSIILRPINDPIYINAVISNQRYRKMSFEQPLTDPIPKREEQIRKFWQDNHIFQKSLDPPGNNPGFVFYEAPPTANGEPHPGHVLTRVIKDVFPRYKTMTGHFVERKAGWDTHGLPVEIEVEKDLGLHNKSDIESYGVENFIEQCKKSVWK